MDDYNTFALRRHAKVDNEEGSTICLYRSMPYKKCMGLITCITKTMQQILTR